MSKENLNIANSKENSNEFKQYDPNLFKRRAIRNEEAEEIVGDSLNFFQDAFRRLRNKKSAMTSLYLIIFIAIMSIFGPYMNEHRYDWNVQDTEKQNSNKLAPRVPVIENIGIMNGEVERDMSLKKFEKGDYPEGSYEKIGEPFEYRGMMNVTVIENSYILKGIEDNYYWFGTDDLSRDMWTRLWYGTRISLFIGLVAAFLDIVIGVVYGLIAGFFGGKVDLIMMRITEIIAQIPSLVVLVILIVLLEPGLLSIILAISLTNWTGAARVVRAQVLRLKGQEFVLASRTLGASKIRLITKHLFPNIIGQIIIIATFSIPGAIFYEAFLSLLGLGIPAPMASIGTLINDGRAYINTYPHLIIIPSIVISVLMISINLLANGLRDALDPKLKSR